MHEDATKPSKYRRLAGDTLLFGISSFGSRILLLLLTPLYTSLLSEAEYGTADLIQTTVSFLYPVLTLAMADAAMRFAMDKTCRREAVLGNTLLISLLATLFLLPFYPLIALWQPELTAYFGIFLLLFTLFNLHNTLSCFIKGIGMTRLFAIQAIVQTATIIAGNLLFLLGAGWRLEGYLYSLAIGYLLPSLLMFFGGRLWRYLAPPRLEGGLLVVMLRYSLPIIPALLAWEVNSHIDRYMITGILDISQNGLYGAAHKIPTMLTAVLTVFLQAWQLSAIENHGEREESDYHTEVYTAFETVGLLACLALIALSKPIAHLLFAGDFFVAWQYVPMLLVSALFSALAGFLAAAFRAEKKTGGLLLSVILGAAVNILLNLLLLPVLHLQGAAIATAISFFCVWLIRVFSVQCLIRIRLPILRTCLSYLLLAIGTTAIAFGMPYALPLFAALSLLIITLRAKEIGLLCRTAWRFVKKK